MFGETYNPETVFFRFRAVFLKRFCSVTPLTLSTHRCCPPSLIKKTEGMVVFLNNFIQINRYMSWSPVQCNECALRSSQKFQILGGISVRCSRRSPRLWHKRFLFFESVEVTAEINPMIVNWSQLNHRLVVKRFLPLCVGLPPYRPICFVRPVTPQNRPLVGDSAHFENHCFRNF